MKIVKRWIKFGINRVQIIDDLSESNLIVQFIGIILLLLGMGYLFDLVSLSPLAVFSFSLSGVFFILSDIFRHKAEVWEAKKALEVRFKYIRYYKSARSVSIFISVLILISGPYVKEFAFIEPYLDKLGTSTAFIAIGLTVFKIGLDNSKKRIDFYEAIANDVDDLYKELEKRKSEKDQT